MKKYQHLFANLLQKAAFCAVFVAFCMAAASPAHAQSAEVKNLGVYYRSVNTNDKEMYCDYTQEVAPKGMTNSIDINMDSIVSILFQVSLYNYAQGEYYPDGGVMWLLSSPASSSCSVALRQANTYYSLGEQACFKVRESMTSTTVLYKTLTVVGTNAVSSAYSITASDEKSFVTTPAPAGNQNQTDPYVSSALIEYDQPYPNTTPADNTYPNHCLSLCMDVVCTNYPLGASTYSIAFPIQDIRFDIVKYYNNRNISNSDEAVPVRTIDIYPQFSNNGTHDAQSYMQLPTVRCGSYRCSNSEAGSNSTSSDFSDCMGAKYACIGTQASHTCWDISTGEQAWPTCKWGTSTGHTDCIIFNEDGAESGVPMRFCTAWDGNYEHEGELGKSNGMFGFRGHIATNFPGDKMAVDSIEFDTSASYPGMNQIPIQVDVTNVHTVRSTPSLVGKITAVPAQPYTFVYRLSKDADVRLAIFDAATDDAAAYGVGDRSHCKEDLVSGIHSSDQCEENQHGLWDYFYQSADWKTNLDATPTLGCCADYYDDTSVVEYSSSNQTPGVKGNSIVRRLVNWDPRNGEGIKGQDKDQLLNAFDNWDGRNDNGMLLPAGNYVASIQAKSQDEWPGIDFSRAVTRQVSLDPLVLTDVVATGLNKKSTAYATISYIPTESSKVYWEIYTPGTAFNSTKTNSAAATGTKPTIAAGSLGSLVYSSAENKTGRMNYTSRWDGTCQMEDGCTRYYAENEKLSNGTVCSNTNTAWVSGKNVCQELFTKGSPMPDGNYVYVLWAEIPYNGKYVNALGGDDFTPAFTPNATCANSGKEIDGQCFTGVKTLDYKTGILEVERGLVGISIQPVSYSTIGSSPTAYGLDPFIFQYALDRNANVVASVQNTAGVVVRYLTPQTGTANVAQQLNRLSWDGRDEQGRMVTAGTYMFVVEAADGMFPAMKNRATATFPVDMYRITDVATTDVYGDSNARATISYLLSRAMNVQINIYNKDVVIPAYNNQTGEYGGKAAWPPRVCNQGDAVFDGAGPVVASKISSTTACIYVNDPAFVKSMYPVDADAAAVTSNLNVRLQPIKTFDRSATKAGDGLLIMEEWDALSFYNPKNCSSATTTVKTDCKYETIPDGSYPFFISARSDEAFDRYYFNANKDTTAAYTAQYTVNGEPFKLSTETVAESYLYATEKPVSKLNITRGPVYFLDGSVAVYSNAPQLFNASTGPTFIPPYEIDFAVSRAATVEIAVIALEDGMCSTAANGYALNSPVNTGRVFNAKAGDICKFISTMTIANTGTFDANIIRKAYWDGTDHTGQYVKPGIYEIRLTARNYPDINLYQSSVKTVRVNANLFQVFDLLDADSYAISQRDTDMHIPYQISVPMKVAIQIFKPGTTIFDYSKGTLRNPTTGLEVTDINEVLVRSIVGIRPSMTLIDEIWDGRDYAHQEVPDGTYPFRFVTAINSADIDTITGEIIGTWAETDGSGNPANWKVNKVADTYQYQNLHRATIAIGDGRFVCEDWEKTVFFYPNPLKDASKGTLEITKMPVPGTVSIKYFNLAGDLVRDSGYTCVDANNYQTTMGSELSFAPDNNISSTKTTTVDNIRNAALRCKWDRTNQHGKKVAHGVYFGLIDFKAQNGREHCQKVVKIIVP